MILGVDPGITGALVWLSEGPRVEWCSDMPVLELVRNKKKRHMIDIAGLLQLFKGYTKPEHAFIEESWPRPENGSVAAHASGVVFGVLLCALQANEIPYTTVSPQTWKAALSIPAAKDGARARANELLPSGAARWMRVKDHNRAEAALIALWGYRYER